MEIDRKLRRQSIALWVLGGALALSILGQFAHVALEGMGKTGVRCSWDESNVEVRNFSMHDVVVIGFSGRETGLLGALKQPIIALSHQREPVITRDQVVWRDTQGDPVQPPVGESLDVRYAILE